MNQNLITASDLVKRFGSGSAQVTALNGVSLGVPSHSLTVLTGKSGSGKTTLLNCLSGLDMPDEGDVRFAGRTLKSMPEAELLEIRRREIGFVFQTFGLIPILTAAENVGMPLRLIKTATSEREARVKSALDAVGLTRQGPQLPSQLSGGEQQRVAIARAIVSEPRLIIADEPTGQLDSRTGGQIIDLLIAVARTRGTAMIVASHDPNLVDSADQHLHLADGRLA